MSFAYELKKEIAQHRPNLVHHKAALAYGLIRFAKYCSADHVALHTEHRFVARLYSSLTILTSISSMVERLAPIRAKSSSICSLSL